MSSVTSAVGRVRMVFADSVAQRRGNRRPAAIAVGSSRGRDLQRIGLQRQCQVGNCPFHAGLRNRSWQGQLHSSNRELADVGKHLQAPCSGMRRQRFETPDGVAT